MTPKGWRSLFPILVFLIPLIVYVASLNGVWAADHPVSLLDLDYAIYAHHNLALGRVGQFVANSVDIFTHNGLFFTATAPGTAVLAYPFVALGFYLEGGFTAFGSVLLLSELFVALANSLAVYVLYRIGCDFFWSDYVAAFIAFAYAFSTISWPFAEYFFQSDVSALFVLLTVYFALRAVRRREGATRFSVAPFILCGLSLGTAVTIDYVDGVLLLPVLAYLVLASNGAVRSRLRGGVAFLLASSAGVALLLLYNYAAFGNPFTSSEQLYLGTSGLFSGFSYPLAYGLALNFLTPLRSLFLFSPLMVLGVAGLYVKLRPPSFDSRFLFLLLLFLCIVIPYSMWYSPTGGNSYGPRFLVPAMPLLLLPIGSVMDRAKASLWKALAYALFLAGVIVNSLGALTGATVPGQSWWASPFLASAVPDLVHGQVDTWWVSQAGAFWFLPVVAITAVAALSPLVCWLLTRPGG